MKFFTYKDFLNSLHDLHAKGQTFSRPYREVFDAYSKANNRKDFDVVFTGLKKTNHGEKRIRHAIKYDLGRACRLVTIQHENKCIFLFAGEHSAVDKWLDKNRGLSVVVDKDAGIITTLYQTKEGEKDQRPITVQNPGKFKLIEQLDSEQQSLLLDGITNYQSLVKIVNINSWDTDDVILEAVEGLNDQDRADVLIDILLLLREKKNKPKIDKKIDHFKGQYILLEEVNEEEVEIFDGSDEIIRLTNVDPEATRIALESADYRSWMLYMHPDQDKIVQKDFNGAALLRGVSGSGKTAVVINRAIRLAKMYPEEQIAVLTLNKALARLIEDLVNSTSGGLNNLVVKSFWQLCKEQLLMFESKKDKHYEEITWKANESINEIWQEFYHQETENSADVMFPIHQSLLTRSIYPEEYIKEEFDFIRSALSIGGRKSYLDMDREGRCIPMQTHHREFILNGLNAWEEKMKAVGSVDYLGLTSVLYQYINKIKPMFRSILVDEMQDFGTLELEIIRKLTMEGSNDIFLAGDTVQRVHTKQHDFKKAGINIVGRSMSIMQNYRNSREILEAANNILEENLTGTEFVAPEIEFLQPKFSGYSEYLPYILEGETVSEEVTSAVQYLQEILQEEGFGHNGCIAVAGYHLSELKDLAERLKIQLLDGEIDLQNKAIFLSDLEQTKGFEFDHMVIVSCSDKTLPNPNLPPEEAFRDLSRFYVAMTRARKNLILSFSGKISRFIENSSGYFVPSMWREHIVLKDTLQIKAPCATGRVERFKFNPEEYGEKTEYSELSGKDLLLTRNAIGMSKERQDRLLKYITGMRKSAQSVKSNTWKNLDQLFRESQININIILAGGSENVAKEVNYYKELFNVTRNEDLNEFVNTYDNRTNEPTQLINPTVNKWSVIIENTGICMHCGRPSIPGDYVCLQCNPG
jgi:hypothetical protein